MILRGGSRLWLIAVFLLSALPAAAQICTPARGTPLSVTGIAADDPLNMRAGPSIREPIVASLVLGVAGVTATGRSAWAAGQCTTTCSGEQGGLNDRGRAIAYDCKARGRIWYQVKNRRGVVGWALAKHLDPGAQPPPPPPLPAEPVLTYRCGNGQTIRVTLRARTQDAKVDLPAGPDRFLTRVPHLIWEISYESPADGGMRLRGSRDIVEWRAPGADKTRCLILR